MRIIAGTASGRRLAEPKGQTTRPILDALKERLFNILRAEIEGRVVWDLFAGVGNLGLEALSRGAASCLFVERDGGSFAVLKRNVTELGFGDRSRLHRGDALAIAALPAETPPGLVFLDPPFPMVEREPARFEATLGQLAGGLERGALVVFRAPSGIRTEFSPTGLCLRDRRDHGVNRLWIFEAGGPENPDGYPENCRSG
ncbi:MAG: RsmD family RNA methyltransferase [Planctomycetes bacterium]|nr:RsmD family RNA methyltransferase [Planctomycetota bacterium]